MTESFDALDNSPKPKLKIISLSPKLIIVNKIESQTVEEELLEEEVIVAPFLIDEQGVIEDISEIVSKVYEEFSQACDKHNLNWEAEIEVGVEFGVKFAAKLKISPKAH